jgi:hypothetical protein
MRSGQQVPGNMGAEISCRADDEDVHRSRIQLFGFLGIRTEFSNDALGAPRLFREANAATVILHEMAEAHALFLWDDGHQVGFDFVGVGVF